MSRVKWLSVFPGSIFRFHYANTEPKFFSLIGPNARKQILGNQLKKKLPLFKKGGIPLLENNQYFLTFQIPVELRCHRI